jgi:transcriptional regulator with XRE-family HTH domain
MAQTGLDQFVLEFVTARQKALKRAVRQLRREARYSQEEVAEFLGCSRTRITEIEREESGTEFSVGELELLAILFGRHPLDVLHMSGQEVIDAGEMVTSKQTGQALLQVIDCSLPRRIEKELKALDDVPNTLEFSPDGLVIASIVDYAVGEDWQGDEPYQFTILCWDTQSGKLLGQIRRPHVTDVVPVSAEQVVLLRDTAHGRADIGGYHDYESDLLIWDLPGGAITKKIALPERAQRLAISPDGMYVAVYMEETTAIQVWQTSTWEPVCAFELGVMHSTSHRLGGSVRVAREVGQLPQERKFGLWHMPYSPQDFAFLQNDVLIVDFSDLVVELEVGPASRGKVVPPIENPSFACHPVVYARDQHRRIAVLDIHYDRPAGDSLVPLYYQVPKGKSHPLDSYMKWDKRFPGSVFQPVIMDEACILAWTEINTPNPWGRFHKQRVGLLNLVSGRLAMLTDGGRLHSGDNQQGASLSPCGNAVAYWVYPYDGVPRLSIQHFDPAPLKAEGATLVAELERKRRRREEEWQG